MNRPNKNKVLIKSALSLLLLSTSATSYADAFEREQCAGIVRAGVNDCASSEHSCAGLNSDDGYESDWLWLPTGTCNKIANAVVINTVKKE